MFRIDRVSPWLQRLPRGLTALALVACMACLPGCGRDPRASDPGPQPFVAAAKGRIDIEGGLVRLAAKRDGVVHSVLVEEGTRVKAGQMLAVLDDEQTRLSAELARAEWMQAQTALPPLRIRLAAAERELKRVAPLARDDTVERRELDQARDQVRLLQSEIESQQAAVETALRRLKVTKFELEQRVVRAPVDGRIVRRTARSGDGVSTLNVTPLFLFAPDSPRIVRAELEERFLDEVRPNQSAEVMLEANEERRFKARVLRLGLVVGQRTPSDDPYERQDNRVVECVLAIDAPELLVGQRVIVRFLRGG